MEKIAIDVGGVLIVKKDKTGADTNFDVEDVKWMPGSLQAVEELSKKYDLYILSFCGKKTENETRIALRNKVEIFIPEEKWIFTRKREDKTKRMIEHEITTLIDDTPQIIGWVQDAGLKGILFDEKNNWDAIREDLLLNKHSVKKSPIVSLNLHDSTEFPPLG